MPVVVAPNIVEASDFSAGWMPDAEETALPSNALLHSMNLLPNVGGTVQVRRGFKRVTGPLKLGYRLESIHPYNRLGGTTTGNFLMLVLTNGQSNTAGNVQVYAYNLQTGKTERVSPLNKTFLGADGRHYGVTIGGVFYGGGPKDRMYAWDPDGGWQDYPAEQNFRTYVTAGPTNATQVRGDFAFKRGGYIRYTYGGATLAYSAQKSNRFGPYDATTSWYRKNDRMSAVTTEDGETYMRSYRCVRAHNALAQPSTQPGNVDFATYWKKIALSRPRDGEGDVGPDWDIIPDAATTDVGVWHAERLWLRYDNISTLGKSRLQYSAPSKPLKGSAIGELQWDPKDWRVGRVKGTPSGDEGEGGGWLEVREGDNSPITALYSFGYYLLIFKRSSSKVLAGTNRETWVMRDLAPVGCIGPRAVCEHNGTVYFLSDEGFYHTDGAQVEEVPNAVFIRDWLRRAVNWEVADKRDNITMWSFGGYIWISVPTGGGRAPDATVVYDPNSKSFWRLDLRVQAAAINRVNGVDQLFFSSPTHVTEMKDATYAWTGTARRSQSTRTIGGVIEKNLFTNPSFEPREGQTLKSASVDGGWEETTPGKVHHYKSVNARLRGKSGLVVRNERMPVFNTEYEGLSQTFAELSGDAHHISIYVRPRRWRRDHSITYKEFRLTVAGEALAEDMHTFEYVGRGWWRFSALYAGSTTPRKHGFKLAPGVEVQVDKAMCQRTNTLRPYFDGDGGDEAGDHTHLHGTHAMLYQYDHPDVRANPVDDEGSPTFKSDPIPWHMRTAWFPFGVVREERRIRRIWAMVRSELAVTVRGFRNYSNRQEFQEEQTPVGKEPVTYFEGKVMPDSHAVSIGVEGVGAPAAILGVSIETQPRRVRYHTTKQS